MRKYYCDHCNKEIPDLRPMNIIHQEQTAFWCKEKVYMFHLCDECLNEYREMREEYDRNFFQVEDKDDDDT